MKKYLSLSVVFVSTFFFTFLFYKQSLGLNVVLFEFGVLAWLYGTKQFNFNSTNQVVTFLAVFITATFTIIHHSTLSYFMNFLMFFTFIGVIIAPEVRSLLNSLAMAISNIFMSWSVFREVSTQPSPGGQKKRYAIWRLRYFLIPTGIIILFSTIYSWANPEFGKIIDGFWEFLGDKLSFIFESIDITIVFTLLLGIAISTFLLLHARNKRIVKRDLNSNDDKIRVRSGIKRNIRTMALVNEYRSAIFLFAALNILLLGLNIMDIDHVWLHFEWEGQYLKQFVHYGTYILIVAILLSIILVLYFFRGNLNYYGKNKWLKILCYVWLGQNVFLAVSAGIRNWYYIEYFALAHKRIAVVFFLLLTIYGLYSVYCKIQHTKSNYYLLRTNAYAWLFAFVLSSGFNWDRIIAKYNFENSKKSFVHLNFLSDLSPTALPYLDQPTEELADIDVYQEQSFFSSIPFKAYRKMYMGPDEYTDKIQLRKKEFIREWEQKSFLEWNYAEYKAYHEIIGK